MCKCFFLNKKQLKYYSLLAIKENINLIFLMIVFIDWGNKIQMALVLLIDNDKYFFSFILPF